MIINVSQISEEDGLRVDHHYPEGEPRLSGEDSRIIDRPTLTARVTRKGSQVRLAGTVRARVQIDCGRCLAPISLLVDKSFDLSYVPPINSVSENEERGLAEEDLRVGFYQGDVIDLDDLMREEIELAVPMSRLCREECKGLCPNCGANLNEGECGCAFEKVDPRWAALKDLKLNS